MRVAQEILQHSAETSQNLEVQHSRPLLTVIHPAAQAASGGSPAPPEEHAIHCRLSKELEQMAAAAREAEAARPADGTAPVPRPRCPPPALARETGSGYHLAAAPNSRASHKRALQQPASPAKRVRSSGRSLPLTRAAAALAPLVPTPPPREPGAASQQPPMSACPYSALQPAHPDQASAPPSRRAQTPALAAQTSSPNSQAVAQLEGRKQALQQQLALLQRQLVASLLCSAGPPTVAGPALPPAPAAAVPRPAPEQSWPRQQQDQVAALPAGAEQGNSRHVTAADAGMRPPGVPLPAGVPGARDWQRLQLECQQQLQALADQEESQGGSDACSSASSSSSPTSSQRRLPALAERLERAEHMLRAAAALTRCPLSRAVMQDPVVAADGHTYERLSILAWLRHSSVSPITGQALRDFDLKPNFLAKLLARLVLADPVNSAAAAAAGSAARGWGP